MMPIAACRSFIQATHDATCRRVGLTNKHEIRPFTLLFPTPWFFLPEQEPLPDVYGTAASGHERWTWRGKIGAMRVSAILSVARMVAVIASAVASVPATAENGIKFALDWRFEGPAAPFLVAIDKGYFTAEGLDVSIEPGNGSVEPISRVASGGYEFGFGDINTLIRFRDQTPANPAKAVFMIHNKPPFAIISRKSRSISVPKDLEGKKLGAPAGDAAFAQWPVFVQANGIDAAKVKVENVGFPVREPMLAAAQVDAITGFSFSAYVTLKDRGVPVDDLVLMLMADYGVNLYGNAIIVNAKFAAEKPDAVRAFLRAVLKGLTDSVRDPARAIDSVVRRNDLAKRETELERLRMAIRDNIVTAEVKANGYGAVDFGRLQTAIDQIGQSYKFKAKPNAADIFDDGFLPNAAERRFR
jgi:NitT/TauT family transport system substrate-binding protein